VAELYTFNSLVLTAIFICQVNPYNLLMRQNLSYNDHVLYSNLIEYIQTVLVVFMNDEPDMSARELKIQSFLFFLLVI